MASVEKKMSVIILAAGKGTRMKSDKAKVLHELCGRPMLAHVVEAAKQLAGNQIVVVVGHQGERVRQIVSDRFDDVAFADQPEQLGTGHAVQCALPHVADQSESIVILCGDVPLISALTIRRFIEAHTRNERDLTVLAVDLDDPTGYGRMLVDERNRFLGIVEHADATPEQKKIKTVNSGIYCAKPSFLKAALERIDSGNAQGEFYLTDIVEIGHRSGHNVGVMTWPDSEEVMGVNTLDELEHAENIMKIRSIKTT